MLSNEQWKPQVRFNLLNGTTPQFHDCVEQFEKWRLSQQLKPLELTTGWHTITPQMAEAALQRNGKNRSVHLPTVLSYAAQMKNGSWKKTGQPITFTDDGLLLDGQHRLWAAYLSGQKFDTYVLIDVPHETMLFAYVDNVRPRTGADALQTAGSNGLAKHISSVIELANRWDHYGGTLRLVGPMKVVALSPREEVAYQQEHPDLLEVAHYIDTNFKIVKSRLGARITTFLGWKIAQSHGAEALDAFYDAIQQPDLPDNHPVKALRQQVEPTILTKKERDRRLKPATVPEVQVLAYAIIAFNMMMAGQNMSPKDKGKLPLNGLDFPEIAPPTPPAPPVEQE